MHIFSYIKKHTSAFVMTVMMTAANGITSSAINLDQSTLDSLRLKLQQATTAKDSIPLLYNIYDVTTAIKPMASSRQENHKTLTDLYFAALRAGDTISAFDAARNVATVSSNSPENIDAMIDRVSSLPETIDKQEVTTFLRLQRTIWVERDTNLTDEQRRDNFHNVRRQLESVKGSKSLYDKIYLQLALILYGGSLVQADRMESYLDELGRLVEQTQGIRSPIKSYYYTQAAIFYEELENRAKTVEVDRKMLNLLAGLEDDNKRIGRIYKTYDRHYFVVYRRMLSNYDYLSPGEADMCYEKLKNIEGGLLYKRISQPDRESVEAFWNLSKKKYNEALKSFRTVMSSSKFRLNPRYIQAYIEAAANSGSLDDVIKGQQMYIELLKRRAKEAADSEYARMRLAYDVEAMEKRSLNETRQAQREAQEAEHRVRIVSQRYTIYGLVGLGIFLLTVIIIQVVANRRSKRMATQLKDANNKLTAERDSLRKAQSQLMTARDRAAAAVRQKSEFIHNISHEISEPVNAIIGFTQLIVDSIPEERRRYLEKFVTIINQNSRILKRLGSDVLDSADQAVAVTSVNAAHFRPIEMLKVVADNFMPRLNKDQSIVVEPIRIIGNDPDGQGAVDTDPQRLEQIMMNLVSNSIKFADHGKIIIGSILNYDTGMLTLTVTDEGPGIPQGKEEVIFGRFEKLGRTTQGLGLGLFVSRRIANLLNGKIYVDTTYHKGARFVLTVPISLRANRPDTSVQPTNTGDQNP